MIRRLDLRATSPSTVVPFWWAQLENFLVGAFRDLFRSFKPLGGEGGFGLGYKYRCLVTVVVSRYGVQMPNPLSTAFVSLAVTLKLRSSRIQLYFMNYNVERDK